MTLTDNEGKLAVECIPPVAEGDLESQAAAERVGRLLREAATTPSALPNGGVSTQSEVSRESSLSMLEQGEGLSLEEAGLKLGDTVVVGPQSSNPKVCVCVCVRACVCACVRSHELNLSQPHTIELLAVMCVRTYVLHTFRLGCFVSMAT